MACFINDLATVLALGLMFSPFTYRTLRFVAASIAAFAGSRRDSSAVSATGLRSSKQSSCSLYLFGLGALAAWADSEAVLPAYVMGMMLAGTVGKDHALVRWLRTVTFGLLTPFYFIGAGSFVSVPALMAAPLAFLVLLAAKMVTKFVSVYPLTRIFGSRRKEGLCATMLMPTGLTFGGISTLFGLTHGIVTQDQYSFPIAAVIGSAVVSALIANAFFLPHHLPDETDSKQAAPAGREHDHGGAVTRSLPERSNPMPHAIRIHQTGGPEVLKWEEVTVGDPGPGEARVRHTAIGLNYLDTYHRSGLYKLQLPSGIGSEAAGVVEAVGAGVSDIKADDRVAYCAGPVGAYSEVRLVPADRLVKLPESISDRAAASLMLKGLTVQYLLRQTYPLKGGETILLHAAAGGVGLIACQWARALGATVIGTVGSDGKAALAKANGCTHTIVYTRENFVERVKELTGGKGVQVVYDAVGKDTFPGSLDCLMARGMFVSFGNTSGAIPPFDILLLSQKGSLYVTRPTLYTYSAKRADLLKMADELFSMVQSGKIKNDARQTYALKDAAQAHRDLEARKTTGSTVLLP